MTTDKPRSDDVDSTSPDSADSAADAAKCLNWLTRARSDSVDADWLFGAVDETARQGDTGLEPTSAPTDEAPRRIGRFEIHDYLGRGGYGVVLLATDPDLNRRVAVKLPGPDVLMDRSLRSRFLRESEAAAALSHPHIVTVHEAGQVGEINYIASEYIEGSTLAEWLSDNPGGIEPEHAAALVHTLAQAVQHAHSRGVLHRDIKPGNVLLSHERSDTPAASDLAAASRLTDFGLARIEHADRDQTADHTKNSILGTPAYMSPEQADGRPDDISSATDVYALGTILYELLTGSPPFQEHSVLATLEAVRSREPERPSRRQAGVPADLEAICLKCLEKEPTARYPTASELAADLQRFLAGESVSVRRRGAIEDLWKWCRRNPAFASVSAIAAVAIVVGGGLVAWQWQRAETNLTAANTWAERADRDRIRTRNALDAMTSEQLNPLTSQRELTPQQREFLQQVVAIYEQLAAEEPDTPEAAARVASAHQRVGLTYARLGEFEKSEASLKAAIGALEELTDRESSVKYRVEHAGAVKDLAVSLAAQRRHDEALPIAERLVQLSDAILADSPDNQPTMRLKAEGLDALANIYRAKRDFDESTRNREAAFAIWEKLVTANPDNASDRSALSASWNNHANLLCDRDQFAEGTVLLERALEIKRELADEHPDSVRFRFDLGIGIEQLALARYQDGKYDTVEEFMQQAMAIYRKLVTDYPLDRQYALKYGVAQINVAAILNSLGSASAEQAAQDAITQWEAIVATEPGSLRNQSMLALSHSKLGAVHRDALRHAAAVDAFTSCISVCESLDVNHPAVRGILADALAGRGTALVRLNKAQQAKNDFDRAEELALNDRKRDEFRVAAGLADLRLGNTDEALTAAREVIEAPHSGGDMLFHAACVLSVAAELSSDNDEAARLKEEALGVLRRATAAGFQLARVSQAPELDSIRDSDLFREHNLGSDSANSPEAN